MIRSLLNLLALSVVLASVGKAAFAADPPPKIKPNYIPALFELQLDPPAWKKLFEIPEFKICGSLKMAPDGESVLFDGAQSFDGPGMTAARILHYSLDGQTRRELCQGTMPTLSPDGKRLAFSSYQDRGVWIADADGGNPRKLEAAGWGIQWSSVSPSEVAYTRNASLVVHDVDTGVVRDVFPGGVSPYSMIHYNFAWSPDGRRIAFLGQTAELGRELAMVDTQGAEFGYRVHFRSRASSALNWHADGNRLIFPMKTDAGWYEIHQLDVAAAAEQATIIPGQPDDRNRIAVCCHPDGKRLFVLSYEMKHPITGETYVPAP